ncbi:DciA family protein [Candidatus Azobacteroides pseudotrichonymphae]|jgi:hypothetical protein|uniref:DUF721 domain-containing protein n=1 Tax=Azobacteroides pseudotrichonymphae genomovar. CFP2 TaxID=511995 RepID=B6YR55_AZOPC|nr:DciA family protein [Candidatus Azobacteroides pseudotrichonymphae]MDR0529922.1 DUF721 domain-containing protein [Bacteroidales bacterium OttesenSCG-928-I14]BAG83677.1 conserved hypothetical protein [Candidatus Azobacteroides pseudotrichonymphae genomovar. CFP2]
MQRTDPQPIGKILKKFLEANLQMADKLAEARIIDYWNSNTTPNISRYTCNLFIKNRVFYVKINSSVLKNELMMQREKKVVELNKVAGRNIINRIVFT